MFDNFAVADPFDLNLLDLDTLACWRDAEQITSVCATHSDANRHRVFGRNDVFNGVMQIGKGSADSADNRFKSVGPGAAGRPSSVYG